MKISLLVITVAVIGLTGCQTQMQHPNVAAVGSPDQGLICIYALPSKPELSVLLGKVILGRMPQPTLEMLSNTTKPTDEEKIAIAAWVNARQECNDLRRQWATQVNMATQFVAIRESSMSIFMLLTADLYNGKFTYGEYTRARAEFDSKFQQQWAAEVQRLQQHQAAAEEQRRELVLMYLLNQPKPVPVQAPVLAPMPIPRSTYTNCHVIGNFMNCTTQ